MKCCWVKQILFDIEKSCFTASSIRLKRKLIQLISCFFECKWPHDCRNVIGPVSFCMQKKCTRDECRFFDSSSYYSILIVSAHSTEGNLLMSIFNCLLKTRIFKSSGVCSIRRDSYASFACMPFKSCLSK